MMAGSMVGLILLLLGFASKEALGYGDGLLLSATGIFLGFQRNCLLLFCAVLCASLFSICLLTAGRKKKEDRIPFAPFVLAGFILQQLLQEGMVP